MSARRCATLARALAVVALVAGCTTAPLVGSTPSDDAADSSEALAAVEASLSEALAGGEHTGTSLRSIYARYLTIAPRGPARAARAIEYAELLIAVEAYDEAVLHLRGALETTELPVAQRARAARLLVDTSTVIWKQAAAGPARLEAAMRMREQLYELQREPELLAFEHADHTRLRAQLGSLLLALGWDIAMSHKHAGLASGARESFMACAVELIDLYNVFEDKTDGDSMLAEAADCEDRAYRTGSAIRLLQKLLEVYPESKHRPTALFELAELQQRVLSYREALELYRELCVRHGEHELAAHARKRWLRLSVSLGDPIADILAIGQLGTLDERKLAAAVEFRAARQTGELEALAAYLAKYRSDGGPAREIAVRIALATEAMARSCPQSRPGDPRATGLCTSMASDGRLGEVLPRNRGEQRRAERELKLVRELMGDGAWRDDPLAEAGPPLALESAELLELEATVALLVGDLSAEEALGVQPPRTYEASRTRIWLDERKSSVAVMVAAYETVGASDAARAAAAAERSAQVYESDATLLARVTVELRDRGALELAAELEQLERERLSQALAAYQQCLASIAAYGGDPSDVQHACRLGVGRLAGRHEPEPARPEPASLGALLLGTN